MRQLRKTSATAVLALTTALSGCAITADNPVNRMAGRLNDGLIQLNSTLENGLRRADRAVLPVSATQMGAGSFLVRASHRDDGSATMDDLDFVVRPELDRRSQSLCKNGYSVIAEGNTRQQYELDYFSAHKLTPISELSPAQRMILTMPAPVPEVRWQIRCDGGRGWIGPGRLTVEAPLKTIMAFPVLRDSLTDIIPLRAPVHSKLTLWLPSGVAAARSLDTALDAPDDVRALRMHRSTVAALAEGIKKRGIFTTVEVREYDVAPPAAVRGEVTLAVDASADFTVTLTRSDASTLSSPVDQSIYEKYTGRPAHPMTMFQMVPTAVVAMLETELRPAKRGVTAKKS